MTEIEVTETRFQRRWIPQLGKQFFIHRQKKAIVGGWVWDTVQKLWPDEIALPRTNDWPSDNVGWYWHHSCVRTFRYNRGVATEVLSNRHVFNWGRGEHNGGFVFDDYLNPASLGYEPEVFETLTDISNWYNPSDADVTEMLTYITNTAPAGTPTATQEVVFTVDMFREKQWTNSDPSFGWAGWTSRLSESTGSWPYIMEVAFRYI